MQIGPIESQLPAVTTPAVATPQPPTGFQALANSLIALLSDDDSQADSSNGLSSLLGEDDTSGQSTDPVQSPPDSPSALLLQAQLGL